LAWLTRKTYLYPAILESLEQLAAETKALGIADAGLARLHSIRGCLLISLGKYGEALRSYEIAYDLSRKHGDEIRAGSSADNISLCQGRVGDYRTMEIWAERALVHFASGGDPWRSLRTCGRIAWALGMRGDISRALQRLSEVPIARPETSRAWVAQADGLLRADIYVICGEPDRAVAQASDTLEATGMLPLSRAYSGTVARWAAKTGRSGAVRCEARALLERMTAEVAQYDAMDQVEVLSARIWQLEQEGVDWQEGRAALREGLRKLPEAMEHQLRRLQILS
jgi:tetratricopeptide (TPR) repeat protein